MMNIDWNLFKQQKDFLINAASDENRNIEETDVFDGVIALMDYIQDNYEPYDIDENDE